MPRMEEQQTEVEPPTRPNVVCSYLRLFLAVDLKGAGYPRHLTRSKFFNFVQFSGQNPK